MRQNTLITLGASAVCGLIAVFLARGWISEAIRDEYRDNLATVPQEQVVPFDTVPVLVAEAPLEFGDVLTPELLKIVDMPEDAIPEGTYSSLNALFVDPDLKTVVLRRMSANEMVLSQNISGPGARGSLSALVNEGMRAVSVRVDDVTGVAGFVMPSDYVDILFTRDRESGRTGDNLVSDVILQNVRVLGIDQNLNEDSSLPDIVKTVTLEVTNEEAQKLQLAMGSGRLSLTLRSAGDQSVDPTKSVHQSAIVSGSKTRATVKTTAPRRVASQSKPKPVKTTADVTIIRGDQRDEVEVQRDDVNSDLAGG